MQEGGFVLVVEGKSGGFAYPPSPGRWMWMWMCGAGELAFPQTVTLTATSYFVTATTTR